MDADMEIIDSHFHLWTPTTHPWLAIARKGGISGLRIDFEETYLGENYKADIDGYNVSQSVHIEAGWPGDPVGETKWLTEMADKENGGIPQALVGNCNLSGDNADEVLQRHSVFKRMRGIRDTLCYHPDYPQHSLAKHDNFLTDVKWIEGFGLLEKYQMSFEMLILPRQMKRAADVIKQYPNIMVMVGHCGFPYVRDEPTMKLWKEGLQELSRYPNVYCKASGMFLTDPKWDQKSVDMVVKPLFEMFGFNRTVFASNFPVDKVNGTFPQLIDALRDTLKPFSLQEQEKFFSDNSKRFYRL